jgi:hypothetical protein
MKLEFSVWFRLQEGKDKPTRAYDAGKRRRIDIARKITPIGEPNPSDWTPISRSSDLYHQPVNS